MIIPALSLTAIHRPFKKETSTNCSTKYRTSDTAPQAINKNTSIEIQLSEIHCQKALNRSSDEAFFTMVCITKIDE